MLDRAIPCRVSILSRFLSWIGHDGVLADGEIGRADIGSALIVKETASQLLDEKIVLVATSLLVCHVVHLLQIGLNVHDDVLANVLVAKVGLLAPKCARCATEICLWTAYLRDN